MLGRRFRKQGMLMATEVGNGWRVWDEWRDGEVRHGGLECCDGALYAELHAVMYAVLYVVLFSVLYVARVRCMLSCMLCCMLCCIL